MSRRERTPGETPPLWALYPPPVFAAQKEHTALVEALGLEAMVGQVQAELDAVVASFAMGSAKEP